MEQFNIPKKLVLDALWFSCAVSSQTYERTLKSQKSILLHTWRIFTGKLGELAFVAFLLNKGIVDKTFYSNYLKDSLSIFWGKKNVDEFDLVINTYKIDVKTLPEITHQYLIIPEDQYLNQYKDFYVCVSLIHKLNTTDKKISFLNRKCFEVYTLLQNNKKIIKDFNIIIKGFIPREHKLLKFHNRDKICPEKACYRIHVTELTPINQLFEKLNRNSNHS